MQRNLEIKDAKITEYNKQVTELTVLKRWTEENECVEFEIEQIN